MLIRGFGIYNKLGPSMNPAYISLLGLVFDIIGACLMAADFFWPFKGQTVIDIGDSGAINGGSNVITNPDAISHAASNKKVIHGGLALLVLGFVLQGAGTWLSAQPSRSPSIPIGVTSQQAKSSAIEDKAQRQDSSKSAR
jgi:hypothetical protein